MFNQVLVDSGESGIQSNLKSLEDCEMDKHRTELYILENDLLG